MEWENMKIARTSLSKAEHGIMIGWLHCEAEGTGQGFGGLALNHPTVLGNWIEGVLAATGVNSWEELTGSFVRVGREEPYGPIVAIKPILSDTPVFRPSKALLDGPCLEPPPSERSE